MKGPKKKNKGRWELHNIKTEEYTNSKKEKEFLSKYKKIAEEYLEVWELKELFKKYNYNDEEIERELKRIKLGDEFKWKEIKNGKPVTNLSTDQIRKKKYYWPEKSYNSYIKSEEENNELNNYTSYNNNKNNKRSGKGSYNKSNNNFYHYVSKKPKRPFQKCIEVPSDYLPSKNNKSNFILTDNNNNNIAKDIINENNEKKNKDPIQKYNFDEKNIVNINNNLNANNNEEKILDEKNINDEKNKNIVKGEEEIFNSSKKTKASTEIKKDIDSNEKYSGKENNEDSNKEPGPEINNLNQDLKKNKELRKKYFKEFFGKIKNHTKKVENNLKRATSKDSDTSDDKSPENETHKKRKKYIILNKKNEEMKNIGVNRNFRNTYKIEKQDIEFQSKVINISINSCYDNPYRDQYLKLINEKRKQNPGKQVEFIIPQFNNNPYMQSFPSIYSYNPYINQNMFMYPPPFQIQGNMAGSQINPQINNQINPQVIKNEQINQQANPQFSIPLNQQYNLQMRIPISPKLNSPNNSPLNSQINLQSSPQINQQLKFKNYYGMNDPQLLSTKINNEIDQ